MEPAIIIAIIVGLTEVLKRLFKLNKRYVPALAVALGLAIMLISGFGNYGYVILTGIIYGLSAVGLFSGVKNTIKK